MNDKNLHPDMSSIPVPRKSRLQREGPGSGYSSDQSNKSENETISPRKRTASQSRSIPQNKSHSSNRSSSPQKRTSQLSKSSPASSNLSSRTSQSTKKVSPRRPLHPDKKVDSKGLSRTPSNSNKSISKTQNDKDSPTTLLRQKLSQFSRELSDVKVTHAGAKSSTLNSDSAQSADEVCEAEFEAKARDTSGDKGVVYKGNSRKTEQKAITQRDFTADSLMQHGTQLDTSGDDELNQQDDCHGDEIVTPEEAPQLESLEKCQAILQEKLSEFGQMISEVKARHGKRKISEPVPVPSRTVSTYNDCDFHVNSENHLDNEFPQHGRQLDDYNMQIYHPTPKGTFSYASDVSECSELNDSSIADRSKVPQTVFSSTMKGMKNAHKLPDTPLSPIRRVSKIPNRTSVDMPVMKLHISEDDTMVTEEPTDSGLMLNLLSHNIVLNFPEFSWVFKYFGVVCLAVYFIISLLHRLKSL